MENSLNPFPSSSCNDINAFLGVRILRSRRLRRNRLIFLGIGWRIKRRFWPLVDPFSDGSVMLSTSSLMSKFFSASGTTELACCWLFNGAVVFYVMREENSNEKTINTSKSTREKIKMKRKTFEWKCIAEAMSSFNSWSFGCSFPAGWHCAYTYLFDVGDYVLNVFFCYVGFIAECNNIINLTIKWHWIIPLRCAFVPRAARIEPSATWTLMCFTRGSEAWWNATTPVDRRPFLFFSFLRHSIHCHYFLTWLNKYNFYRNIIINLCSISGKAHIVQCQFNLLSSYRRLHIVWPSNVIFIHSILFKFIARRCFCGKSTIKQGQRKKMRKRTPTKSVQEHKMHYEWNKRSFVFFFFFLRWHTLSIALFNRSIYGHTNMTRICIKMHRIQACTSWE